MGINTELPQNNCRINAELDSLISTWASGGFHDSQAAYDAFAGFIRRRERQIAENCALAVCLKLDELQCGHFSGGSTETIGSLHSGLR